MEKSLEYDSSPKAEWILLLVLAAIQFVHILDFVIIMPLGPQFMEVFRINPTQFGFIVSSYTFSASLFGFIAAFFIDRFDRKKALLLLLAGFTIGCLLCAMAPTYGFLIFARILSGAFGGLMGATVFAIIGDVIPAKRRGAATGTVMSGFSVASIVGIPAGLFMANHSGWHAPFYLLTVLSAIILYLGYRILPQMNTHFVDKQRGKPFKEMQELLSESNHIRAFSLTIMLMLAGFSVIPYLSPYMVSNVGLTNEQLPYIYFFGGLATLFTARFIGKLADRFGKLRMFIIMAFISVFPILAITHLPKAPLVVALSLTTFFMICTSGRMIPAMAMVTGSVKPEKRGSFMSINSSIQNLGSGLAAVISGAIITQTAGGQLANYNIVGIIASVATLLCIYLATRLRYDEAKPVVKHVSVPAAVQKNS